MKKAFVLILSVFPMIASGDYLDDKIADLTKQKLEKIAELEECQKSTKGLKIAGITTLGVSTVGIAANIGEAVALKKLDGQISEAETKLGDLDEKIQDKKDENVRKEQQANTCGVQQCDSVERDAKIATLNAKNVVCVNGAWVPSACEDGFSGTTETCTLNSETVTYYMSCTQDAKKCDTITDEWKKQNHVEQVECDTTTGKYYITKCKDGFTGTEPTSGNKQGYKMCQKKQVQEKKCPYITDEWLNKNNAKSATCDKITGEIYITECKENYVGIARVAGDKQGYEKCQKKQDDKSGEKSGGGDATTTIKDCPRTIPPVNYVLNCEGMCQQYATQNSCKIKEIYEGTAGCICNPNDADKGNLLKGLLEIKCPEITEAWKNAQHALSAECDTTIGENYITECKDGFTGTKRTSGNKQGYKMCQKNEVQEKNCPDITDEWLNKNNAKSGACDEIIGESYITECKDGYFPERNRYGVIWGCIEKAKKN